MTDDPLREAAFVEEDEGPVIQRRPVADTSEMDITPLIDITFLLLIFFLVSSTLASQSVELPPARSGQGVSERTAVIFTVDQPDESEPAEVFMDDGISAKKLSDDPAEQDREIAQAVERAYDSGQGKSKVLIRAAKRVLYREVSRVRAAAGSAKDANGVPLNLPQYLAVFDKD